MGGYTGNRLIDLIKHPKSETNLIITSDPVSETGGNISIDYLNSNIEWTRKNSIAFELIRKPDKLSGELKKWSMAEYKQKTPNNINISSLIYSITRGERIYLLTFSVRREFIDEIHAEIVNILNSFQFL